MELWPQLLSNTSCRRCDSLLNYIISKVQIMQSIIGGVGFILQFHGVLIHLNSISCLDGLHLSWTLDEFQ